MVSGFLKITPRANGYLRCDQVVPNGIAHKADRIVDVKLLHDVTAVAGDRLNAYPELLGYLFSGEAFCD